MTERVDIAIDHDGAEWVTSEFDVTVRAPDIGELGRRVVVHLTARGRQAPADIHLCCERELLPSWMRQYGAHYFNHVVRFEPEGGEHDDD